MLRWQWAVLPVLAGAVVVLYLFNPSAGGFPACPFRSLTGLLCPGCGSQRAIHELLHGHIGAAFGYNALLVVSIPFLALHVAWGRLLKAVRPLSSYNLVVLIWTVAILGWGVLRNT